MSPGWPDDRFCALLGSRHPIVAAPMAGAAGVELAVAAIDGGAVGSLPCPLLTPETVRAQAAEVRSRAGGPLNLNFFCHAMPEGADDVAWRTVLQPYYDEFGIAAPDEPGPQRRPFDEAMAEAVEEIRPELVSFHFGLPDSPLLARVRGAGCRILATATTVAEARWLIDRGVDAVIAQGFEAGGHAGRFLPDSRPEEQMGLFALLPQVVDAVADVPVIAAGGIGDARGVAAAFLLGAAAVQLGTFYLRSPESLIPAEHRAALGSAATERTAFTNLYSGGLARGLPTRLTDELGWVRGEAPPFPLAASALAPLARAARERGESGYAPAWSGQSARLSPLGSARQSTERLAAEALALLGQRA